MFPKRTGTFYPCSRGVGANFPHLVQEGDAITDVFLNSVEARVKECNIKFNKPCPPECELNILLVKYGRSGKES